MCRGNGVLDIQLYCELTVTVFYQVSTENEEIYKVSKGTVLHTSTGIQSFRLVCGLQTAQAIVSNAMPTTVNPVIFRMLRIGKLVRALRMITITSSLALQPQLQHVK